MSFLGRLFSGAPSVSASEARELVDAGAVMVDVRTTSEWNAGHSALALHMALDQLSQKQRRIPKDKKVVVVCRSGNRSRGAAKHLIESGYDAVNLAGGMHAWQRSGESLVDRSGKPGRVA
ncbi:MAG: rhodanese-like domain-containing protein [Actinomycetia bacterium]|nr:rhodanese-like domain-containing protein [Actinomycetes bacterium]